MHIPEGKQGKAGALSLDTFWPGLWRLAPFAFVHTHTYSRWAYNSIATGYIPTNDLRAVPSSFCCVFFFFFFFFQLKFFFLFFYSARRVSSLAWHFFCVLKLIKLMHESLTKFVIHGRTHSQVVAATDQTASKSLLSLFRCTWDAWWSLLLGSSSCHV